jgi:oligopeptide transport system substrate-binding protein
MIHLRGISISKILFEGLTRINDRGEAQLTGAKSVKISADRLHYTFTLRKNTWSDGTPVTAQQYELAWKEALSPTSSCSRADLLFMIKNAADAKKGNVHIDAVGVKAIDEKTLFVELAFPSPFFLELLAQPICAPLIDPKQKEPAHFNGPYVVKKWDHGTCLRLKPNPHYWNYKQVHLKQIEFFMVQDVSTPYALYEKGEIDWIGMPLSPMTSEQIHNMKKENALRTHQIDRAFWVFLNTEHPALASPRIRRALSLAINRAAITNHMLIGGKPLTKPLPSGLLALRPRFSLKENDAEARQLFQEGLQELGFTRETLPPIEITFSQQANRRQVAEYLQETWNKTFGIKVRLQAQEWNVLRSNLEKGLFTVCGCFEAAFYKDPMELLERFVTINPCNFSRWVYQPFVEKLAIAKREQDQEQRADYLIEAEQMLMEQMPFVPICSDALLFSHHPTLKGYVFDCVGAIDFSHANINRD